MKEHARSVLGGLGIASILLAACGSSTTGSSLSSSSNASSTALGSKGTATIGLIAAYTGNQSFEAGFTDAGALPAVSAINAAGGILGYKLVAKQVDTKSDPADALAAVEQMLATTKNLVATSGPDSTSGPTTIPILNQSKIPMMITAGQAAYDRSSYKYLWRDLPPDPANGIAMALWAKQHGYTRVATVFGTDSGSQGDLPGVITGVKKTGAKIVAKINLTPDQPSYRTEVQQLIAAKPQVIMTESDGPTAATFFGDLKQQGTIVPIIGTSGVPTDTYLNPLRSALGTALFNKNFVAVVAGTPSPNPAVTVFNNALKTVKGQLPAPLSQWLGNPFCEAGYDGIISMALAMNEAHSIKGSVYNPFISKVTSPGVGKTIVYTYAAGVKAIQAGKQIQYVGASGPLLFNKYHNSYGNQAVESFPTGTVPKVLGTISAKAVEAVG